MSANDEEEKFDPSTSYAAVLAKAKGEPIEFVRLVEGQQSWRVVPKWDKDYAHLRIAEQAWALLRKRRCEKASAVEAQAKSQIKAQVDAQVHDWLPMVQL